MITYRSHRPGDLAALVALTARATPRDLVNEKRFATNVLLERNFDPSGLSIAEHETDGIVGFFYGTCAQQGVPSLPEDGYITVGAVDPTHRRQGIGTALMRRTAEHLRTRGARRVTVAGYPQAYFVPGLDAAAYPEGRAFLESLGFERLYTAAAMHLDLDAYVTPEKVGELVRLREAEGYEFAPATWDDLPETLTFASQKLAPDWGGAVREAVLLHGRPERVRIARSPEGSVVGFATYAAYEGTLERFGPFGVDDDRRGTGLGRVLLHQTLTQMRSEGAHGAWFLWTGEQSPAGHLYLSTGFEVVRRFEVMRADLEAL